MYFASPHGGPQTCTLRNSRGGMFNSSVFPAVYSCTYALLQECISRQFYKCNIVHVCVATRFTKYNSAAVQN